MDRLTNFLGDIRFVNPEYFLLFIISAVLFVCSLTALFFYLYVRPQRTRGSKYRRSGKTIFWTLLIVSTLFAVIAAARPVTTFTTERYVQGPVDTIFVIDISSSMWVDDVEPSRLEVAGKEVLNMIRSGIFRDGDRVSLIVFGAKASTRAYLTGYVDFFTREVADLGLPNFLTKDRFPWDSDISAVLREIYISADLLDKIQSGDENWQPEKKLNRLAIVFTDGDFDLDENQRSEVNNSMSELLFRGITVYSVGVGTRTGMNLLSFINRKMEGDQYVMKAIANELAGVITKLGIVNVSTLVSGARGEYTIIDDGNATAEDFLRRAVNLHRLNETETIFDEDRNELWFYFLGLSLIFFVVAIIFH